MRTTLFPGFAPQRVRTTGRKSTVVVGGAGPPLLLLHGYPQTHAMWHRIAPALAREFTVVCPDLRGYGDSGKPASDATHAAYAKRAMAQDMVDVMRALGFPRFRLAGHDRGGRVAHRLCVDHPDAVERVAVLDISPTRTMYAGTNQAFATAYYHWFFLIQPFDLARKADRRRSARTTCAGRSAGGPADCRLFDPRALAEYERCFADPATIHASCEDYRAAASIDLEHDDADVAAGRKVTCPLLALWGDKGVVNRMFDPAATTGARSRPTFAARRCRPGTSSPKRRRRKRCANCARFSRSSIARDAQVRGNVAMWNGTELIGVASNLKLGACALRAGERIMTLSYDPTAEDPMLNFNRDNAKSTDKPAVKPAPYPYAPVPPAACRQRPPRRLHPRCPRLLPPPRAQAPMCPCLTSSLRRSR